MTPDVTLPWADRAFLRDVQYATDRNLAARQSIYAYQRPHVDLPAAIIDLVPLTGSEAVADVGCGNGAYLAELARRGHRGEVLGVDMSTGMLSATAQRAPAARLLAGDATALPLRDEVSDLALAMHMLYHVPEPAQAVRELRRVTRRSGRVVIGLNGDDHLRELRDLIGECVAATERQPIPPLRELITLNQGHDLLAGLFDSVVRHDFTGELALPDVEPILSYARSMTIENLSQPALDRLADAVRARLDSAPDGLFRVRTHAGCLICA